MFKTYVIGDLHGCNHLLQAALNLIPADEHGKIIVLGDFVDRGPDTAGLVRTLRILQARGAVILKGNHEDMLVKIVTKGPREMADWWYTNGVSATLRSYGYACIHPHPKPSFAYATSQSLADQLVDDIKWMASLPIIHTDKHRVYVHAGVDADNPLDNQSYSRVLWKLYDDDDEGLHPSGLHVVHGHHQSVTHPRTWAGRTNLDAFAFTTNRLAIGVFDDDTPGGPIEILWTPE